MELSKNITDIILNADGKALGTMTSGVINVVPVSTITIRDNKILLVDYFMGKTLQNIKENPYVSLACWRGLEGYQIKAHVEYVTDGDIFDHIKTLVAEILPERVVRGVLILDPDEIYDISATADKPGIRVDN